MNIYDFTVKNDEGEIVSLREYEGKVLLIVNTATKCGLTSQYNALQDLYEKYKDEGFEILDFPCNQFLHQAPEEVSQINSFCTLNFGTEFSRFSKIDVNGKNADPLYVWLKNEAPEDIENDESRAFEKKIKLFTLGNKKGDIKWNFGKFLIDRSGNVVKRYSPAFLPELLEADIDQLIR